MEAISVFVIWHHKLTAARNPVEHSDNQLFLGNSKILHHFFQHFIMACWTKAVQAKRFCLPFNVNSLEKFPQALTGNPPVATLVAHFNFPLSAFHIFRAPTPFTLQSVRYPHNPAKAGLNSNR